MSTIADSISRIKNSLKVVEEDAFMTDRFVYSLIYKYGKALMKRQSTVKKLMNLHSKFVSLPCVELIEVDKIEACCEGIKSGCKIMRTKEKLPTVMEGPNGPLFRTVSSIDGSIEVYQTKPGLYTSMSKSTNFKYNKSKYFWYINDYLYFPNIEWEAIKVEAIFEDDYSAFICDENENCIPRQDQKSPFPEYLFAEIESMIKQELMITAQLPPADAQNKQDTLR